MMHGLHTVAGRRGENGKTVNVQRLTCRIFTLPAIPQTRQQQSCVLRTAQKVSLFMTLPARPFVEPTHRHHTAPVFVWLTKTRQRGRGFRLSVKHAVLSAGLFRPTWGEPPAHGLKPDRTVCIGNQHRNALGGRGVQVVRPCMNKIEKFEQHFCDVSCSHMQSSTHGGVTLGRA